jgi:hypothetical protein
MKSGVAARLGKNSEDVGIVHYDPRCWFRNVIPADAKIPQNFFEYIFRIQTSSSRISNGTSVNQLIQLSCPQSDQKSDYIKPEM